MWSIFTNNDYFDSDPIRTTVQESAILAIWIILWVCFALGICLFIAPASAIEINPSVEKDFGLCTNELTGWTCDIFKGPQGTRGPQGIENMTMNMTLQLPTTYYLHNATTTANSSEYHTMKRYYPTGAEDSNTTTLDVPNTNYLLAQFITDENDPNLGALPPGDRKWFTYVSTDSLATGDTHLEYKLYSYHTNGTKSLIYHFVGQNLYDTAITRMVDQYTLSTAFPMNTSDRFIMEYYANTTSGADRTITMYWDDASHVSKIESPITLTCLQGPPGPAGTAINESYAYLPGRAGGQTLYGGNAANDDLVLSGTSSSTKTTSYVNLQPDGGKVGFGTIYPNATAHIKTTTTIEPILLTGKSFDGSADGANGVTIGMTHNEAGNRQFAIGDSLSGMTLRVIAGGSYPTISGYNYKSLSNLGLSVSGIMRIPSTQDKVGYGTPSPTAQIDATGSIRFRNCTGTPTFDSGGNLTCVSDEKLKANIKRISPSGTTNIDKIKALSAVCWNWKYETGYSTSDVNCGFLAGEVKTVIPEAIKTKKEYKYETKQVKNSKGETEEVSTETPTGASSESIDQGQLIQKLVLAMQEQQTQIEQLQAEVARIEGKMVDKT